MNGPEHYAEAQKLIESAGCWENFDRWNMEQDERQARRANDLAEAQVHATLALTAATVEAGGLTDTADSMHGVPRYPSWAKAVRP